LDNPPSDKRIFCSSKCSRLQLIQWVLWWWGLSLVAKWPGCKANYSSQLVPRPGMVELTSTAPYLFVAQSKFYVYLYYAHQYGDVISNLSVFLLNHKKLLLHNPLQKNCRLRYTGTNPHIHQFLLCVKYAMM
jgi:hypothetical protein